MAQLQVGGFSVVEFEWPGILKGAGVVILSGSVGALLTVTTAAVIGLPVGIALLAVGVVRRPHRITRLADEDIWVYPVTENATVRIQVRNGKPRADFEASVQAVIMSAGSPRIHPRQWPIRWEGRSDERIEILQYQPKTLELADLDRSAWEKILAGDADAHPWLFHRPVGGDIPISFPVDPAHLSHAWMHAWLGVVCRIHRVDPPAFRDYPYMLALRENGSIEITAMAEVSTKRVGFLRKKIQFREQRALDQ